MNNNQNNNPLGTFNPIPNVPLNNEPKRDEQVLGINPIPSVSLNTGIYEQPKFNQNENNQINSDSMDFNNNTSIVKNPLNIIPGPANNNQFTENINMYNNFSQNSDTSNINDSIPFNQINGFNTNFTNNTNTIPPIASEMSNANNSEEVKENNVTSIPDTEDNIISVKKYLGYMVLFSIPVVGFIMLIIKGFVDKKNKNISNFAKANLIFSLIITIFSILAIILPVALLYLGSKEIATNKPDIDMYLPENNKYDGYLYYANSEKLDNVFTYEVPEVFEDESISTSLEYTYGDESIFGDCVFSLNSIDDYDSAETLIKEMSEYYYENSTKKKINGINWHTFSLYGYDETYYFATDVDEKVYLYEFEINNYDIKDECIGYHESIINSIKLK